MCVCVCVRCGAGQIAPNRPLPSFLAHAIAHRMNDTERHRIPAGGSLDLISSPRRGLASLVRPPARECPVVTSHTYLPDVLYPIFVH